MLSVTALLDSSGAWGTELMENQSKGKGKEKVADSSIESELEIRDQKKSREQLTNPFLNASSNQKECQTLPSIPKNSNTGDERGDISIRNFSRPQQQPFVGINPFTGLPIIQETGFEAGPSNRPPPPLWHPPRPSDSEWDVPLFLSTSQTGPSPLPRTSSKASYNKLPDLPSQGLKTASSSRATWQQSTIPQSKSSITSSLKDPAPHRTNSDLSKPLPTRPQSTTDGKEIRDIKNDSILSPNRSKFFGRITSFATKVLKITGNIIVAPRETSIHQFESPPGYRSGTEDTLAISHGPPAGRLRGRLSQETLPPAYDTLPPFNRRSTLDSISSDGADSIFTTSPGTNSTLSPASTGFSFSQSSQHQTTGKILPIDSSYFVTDSQKDTSRGSGWGWTTKKNIPPRRAVITDKFASSAIVDVTKSSGTEINHPESTSSQHDQQNSRPLRRQKGKGIFGESLHDSVSDLTKPLFVGASKTPSRESYQFETQKTINSNNPWKSHMTGDEALARTLQEEEYRDAQLQRDMLLAHALANGTVDDDDLELAYFMSMQTENLIASTNTAEETPLPSSFFAARNSTSTKQYEDIYELDIHPDLLKAQQIQKEIQAEEDANSASLAAALKLQAEFDLDAEAEDGWEAYKKINIQECIVCGDEQHRDELFRPCDHAYCDGCLEEGFKTALKSKTPFKCCKKNLDISVCEDLDTKFITQYQEMMLELTTPNPTYCANARCGKFLSPKAFIADVGSCISCKTKTCKYCRQRHHPGRFCPEDRDTEKVRELAKTKGWKTCPGCSHLIERKDGCLHMVCSRCHTAFCYRCSKKWKDCESTCPDPISATHPKV